MTTIKSRLRPFIDASTAELSRGRALPVYVLRRQMVVEMESAELVDLAVPQEIEHVQVRHGETFNLYLRVDAGDEIVETGKSSIVAAIEEAFSRRQGSDISSPDAALLEVPEYHVAAVWFRQEHRLVIVKTPKRRDFFDYLEGVDEKSFLDRLRRTPSLVGFRPSSATGKDAQ